MKNTLISLTAILLSLIFIFQSGIFVSASSDEYSEVLILLEDNLTLGSAKVIISRQLSFCKYKSEFSVLLKGFAAKVKTSEIEILKELPGITTVYKEIEYVPLSLNESIPETVYATDIAAANNHELGKGKVIAIIDNGFNLRHKQFTLSDNSEITLRINDVGSILNFTNALEKYPFLKPSKAYKSAKVPFAFDYADNDTNVKTTDNHGTAIMSAAAGNGIKSEIYIGAAPCAQVLAMKVFDDTNRVAKTSDIVAALEDAYILGADVINMSLGTPCGFSEAGFTDPILEKAISSLENNGIPVVCPAGNDSTLGESTIFNKYYGYDYPLASMPDSGTVSAPSTTGSVLSVANATTSIGRYYAFIMQETNSYIPYSDTNKTFEAGGAKALFSETFANKTLEYVLVDGIGKVSDFEALNEPIDGKVALIKRGEITFAEKTNNAYAFGAIAAIIYDNEEDYAESLKTQMSLENVRIPAIFISAADGKALISASNKKISIKQGLTYVTNAGTLPYPSYSSSIGPTPTLNIKPEIAASGTKMTVAAANGSYVTLSGTSVSSAYTAGIIAGICKNFDHLEGKEKTDAIKTYLLNCAVPMKNEKGAYYAVNYQGAGLIDLNKLDNNPVTLTSNGNSTIELGNGINESFSIKVTLENNSEQTSRYSLSAVVGTLDYIDVPFSELSSEKDSFYEENEILLYEYFDASPEDIIYFTENAILEFETSRISIDGTELDESKSIILYPGEKKDLTLNIELDKAEIEALRKVYPNGMYVQGYVILEGDVHRSLPFLGFIGDFYKCSPIDTLRSSGNHFLDGTYLYSFYEEDFFDVEMALGTNNLRNGSVIRRDLHDELSLVSPSANNMIYIHTTLTKNLKLLDIKVFSDSGEEVCSSTEFTNIKKSYYDKNTGYANALSTALWDFRSEENDDYIFDDGKYTCIINATDAANNKFTEKLNFIIDSKKPGLAKYSISVRDGKTYLDVTVKDDNYIQAVYAYGFSDKILVPQNDSMPSDETLLTNGKGAEYTVMYEIPPNFGSYVYIKIYDLAFNTNLVRIEL